MKSNIALQQLLEFSYHKPSYLDVVVREFAVILFLENGKPFMPYFKHGDSCFRTKYLQLIQVNCHNNCLLIRPINEYDPSLKSYHCISIDFNSICAIQIFEIKKIVKQNEPVKPNNGSEDEGTELPLDRNKTRPKYIPPITQIPKTVVDYQFTETSEGNESVIDAVNTQEKGKEKKDILQENSKEKIITESENRLNEVMDKKDCIDPNDDDDSAESDSGKRLHSVKKIKNKTKKKKSNYNHWIVPFSTIINIELDEEE